MWVGRSSSSQKVSGPLLMEEMQHGGKRQPRRLRRRRPGTTTQGSNIFGVGDLGRWVLQRRLQRLHAQIHLDLAEPPLKALEHLHCTHCCGGPSGTAPRWPPRPCRTRPPSPRQKPRSVDGRDASTASCRARALLQGRARGLDPGGADGTALLPGAPPATAASPQMLRAEKQMARCYVALHSPVLFGAE